MIIKSYKRTTKDQYEITFDNDQKIVLYEDLILKANLLIKKEITLKEMNDLISQNELYEVYNKAIKLLGIRMKSEKELRNRFKEYSKEAVDYALNRLNNDGYLNHANYIKAYIDDQINFKMSGPHKIKRELKSLGFDDSEIDECLNTINDSIWVGKISKFITKNINSNHSKSNKSLLIKITNDLINKGFPIELIENELTKIELKNDNDLLEKDFKKLIQKYQHKFKGEELKFQLRNRLYQKGYLKEDIENVISDKIKN